MKPKNNPYDKHFKSLRSNSDKKRAVTVADLENELAKKNKAKDKEQKEKKSAKIPWKLGGFSILGLLIAAYGYVYYEDIEHFIARVEVMGFTKAMSQEKPTAEPKKPDAKASVEEGAKSKEKGTETESAGKGEATSEVMSHLTKLQDKKKELDLRESELAKNEEEFAKQREQLEKQLKALEETRTKISSILEEKIKADNEKIDSLVQLYTSMKPPQAAKVVESMDEDLAVEILARMKRKTAAEIMNIVKPEKAQILTEKFAGYKKK